MFQEKLKLLGSQEKLKFTCVSREAEVYLGVKRSLSLPVFQEKLKINWEPIEAEVYLGVKSS